MYIFIFFPVSLSLSSLAPGSPPTRLSGYSLGATSLNVTWYPPAVPNGKITYYTVFYCSSKTISKGWHKIILAGN